MLLKTASAWGLVGLMRRATLVAPGISSRASSSRFAPTSTFNWVTPVTLPPGRLRLPTRPRWTGSLLVVKTMEIVLVAALATKFAGVLVAAITDT